MSLMQAGDVASVLHANHGGNLHAFTGKTDCAVLDLFLPPYNRRQGRDCSYYEEIGPLQSDGTILLKPFEPPEDFVIHNKTYRGQRIKATPTKRKNHVPA
ncbi:hypothetical protein WJX75_001735 [Coccomyxa subellipsoidea]|uniref:cysteine dioxygenase n=1 Tax=Coccomyxa subellipsoidea TaxID=248742 RepID=A0ABR2YM33_9CHLO